MSNANRSLARRTAIAIRDDAEAHDLIMTIIGMDRAPAVRHIRANPPSLGAIVSLVFYGHKLLTSKEQSQIAKLPRKEFTPEDVWRHREAFLAAHGNRHRGWVKAATADFKTSPGTLGRYLRVAEENRAARTAATASQRS